MPASSIVRAVSSGNSGSSASSNSQITVAAPAGVQSGDKLGVFITVRTAMGAAWVAPSGWTLQFGPGVQGSGEGYLYTATYGTDVTGTSWTWNPSDTATANKYSWECVALIGSSVGAVDVATGGGRGTSTNTLDFGPITSTVSGYIVAFGGDRASGSTWTWPAGWVEEVDTQSTGTNSCSATAAVYDTTPTAAGTYSGTATATSSSANAWWGMVSYAQAAGGTTQNGAISATATAAASFGGSASRSAAIAAAGISAAAIGPLLSHAPALAAADAASVAIGGVRQQNGALPVAATAALALQNPATGKVATLTVSGTAALALAGRKTSSAVLSMTDSGLMTVASQSSGQAGLVLAAAAAVALAGLESRTAVLAVRPTPAVVLGGQHTVLATLSAHPVPQLVMSLALVIPDYRPHTFVLAIPTSSGEGLATLATSGEGLVVVTAVDSDAEVTPADYFTILATGG